MSQCTSGFLVQTFKIRAKQRRVQPEISVTARDSVTCITGWCLLVSLI